MPQRPTMADIAQLAGVSRVAVSYALNGRPGVSDEVRQRVLRIARELAFNASGPALVLRGATVKAVGLVIRRRAGVITLEVFGRGLIQGLQTELGSRGAGMLLQFADDEASELGIYRRWAANGQVAGAVIIDLEENDPRPELLSGLGLPAVFVGGPVDGFSCVWADDAAAMTGCLAYLSALGHRHVAHVSGPVSMRHTQVRVDAFMRGCEKRAITPVRAAADYSSELSARATRRILSAKGERPTAILYDNDVMAVAGLSVAREMSIRIPEEVSLIAWEDSPLCQVVRPALTALRRDIAAVGVQAVQLLADVAGGGAPRSVRGELPELEIRSTTGPAQASGGSQAG